MVPWPLYCRTVLTVHSQKIVELYARSVAAVSCCKLTLCYVRECGLSCVYVSID